MEKGEELSDGENMKATEILEQTTETNSEQTAGWRKQMVLLLAAGKLLLAAAAAAHQQPLQVGHLRATDQLLLQPRPY